MTVCQPLGRSAEKVGEKREWRKLAWTCMMELVTVWHQAWQITQSCNTDSLLGPDTWILLRSIHLGRDLSTSFHLLLVKVVSWRMLTPLCFWVPCVYLITKSFTFQNEQDSSRAGQHRPKVRRRFFFVCVWLSRVSRGFAATVAGKNGPMPLQEVELRRSEMAPTYITDTNSLVPLSFPVLWRPCWVLLAWLNLLVGTDKYPDDTA